jgi:hypothetical protein
LLFLPLFVILCLFTFLKSTIRESKVNVILERTHTVIPEKHPTVIPNLIGDPDSFPFIYLKKKYFLDSRFRGNDNTYVILEKHPTVIPNLIGDPVFTSFSLLLPT